MKKKKWAQAKEKSYLNNQEKTELAIVACLQVFLDGAIDKWERLHRPKALLKWARMTRAFTKKLMQEILRPLNEDERNIVIKQVAKLEIVTRTKEEAMIEVKKQMELDANEILPKDDFIALCSFAVTECMTCTKCDYQNCDLRRILMQYDIEAMDQYAEPTQCQYQYKDIKENAVFNVYKDVTTGQLYRVQPGLSPYGMVLHTKAPLAREYWELPKITKD